MERRTRHKQIKIRMTDEEYVAYQEQLEKSKMKGNEYGLSCLLNKPINVVEDIPELTRQLRGIGNNLNQLARAANTGQVMPPPAVEELQKGVEELWRLLRRLKGGKR